MILSRGRRFIFVHIPKTGGTALTLALEAQRLADDIIIGGSPPTRFQKRAWRGVKTHGRLWKHATLADITGLATETEIASFFTLTLVRNPWDRMVSYYHWLQTQHFAHPAVGLAKMLSFHDFLMHPLTRSSLQAWPARRHLTDRSGTERASAYLRLDHLPEDLAPFEGHLGFRLGPVARVNASARPRDWRPFYSNSAAALLAELCAEDIARFGYRFDPA